MPRIKQPKINPDGLDETVKQMRELVNASKPHPKKTMLHYAKELSNLAENTITITVTGLTSTYEAAVESPIVRSFVTAPQAFLYSLDSFNTAANKEIGRFFKGINKSTVEGAQAIEETLYEVVTSGQETMQKIFKVSETAGQSFINMPNRLLDSVDGFNREANKQITEMMQVIAANVSETTATGVDAIKEMVDHVSENANHALGDFSKSTKRFARRSAKASKKALSTISNVTYEFAELAGLSAYGMNKSVNGIFNAAVNKPIEAVSLGVSSSASVFSEGFAKIAKQVVNMPQQFLDGADESNARINSAIGPLVETAKKRLGNGVDYVTGKVSSGVQNGVQIASTNLLYYLSKRNPVLAVISGFPTHSATKETPNSATDKKSRISKTVANNKVSTNKTAVAFSEPMTLWQQSPVPNNASYNPNGYTHLLSNLTFSVSRSSSMPQLDNLIQKTEEIVVFLRNMGLPYKEMQTLINTLKKENSGNEDRASLNEFTTEYAEKIKSLLNDTLAVLTNQKVEPYTKVYMLEGTIAKITKLMNEEIDNSSTANFDLIYQAYDHVKTSEKLRQLLEMQTNSGFTRRSIKALKARVLGKTDLEREVRFLEDNNNDLVSALKQGVESATNKRVTRILSVMLNNALANLPNGILPAASALNPENIVVLSATATNKLQQKSVQTQQGKSAETMPELNENFNSINKDTVVNAPLASLKNTKRTTLDEEFSNHMRHISELNTKFSKKALEEINFKTIAIAKAARNLGMSAEEIQKKMDAIKTALETNKKLNVNMQDIDKLSFGDDGISRDSEGKIIVNNHYVIISEEKPAGWTGGDYDFWKQLHKKPIYGGSVEPEAEEKAEGQQKQADHRQLTAPFGVPVDPAIR